MHDWWWTFGTEDHWTSVPKHGQKKFVLIYYTKKLEKHIKALFIQKMVLEIKQEVPALNTPFSRIFRHDSSWPLAGGESWTCPALFSLAFKQFTKDIRRKYILHPCTFQLRQNTILHFGSQINGNTKTYPTCEDPQHPNTLPSQSQDYFKGSM